MDNMGMDTFLSLVRTQNVSRTAEELNLAQSTVSKRLKQLEHEVGTALFERTKGNKSFLLTSAGQSFIDIAEHWLCVWREIQSLKSGNPNLSLTIGTLDSMNYALFSDFYQKLSRQQPKIKLRIITSHSQELYDLVECKKVDIAFTLFLRENPNILVKKCFTEPMVGLRIATSPIQTSELVNPKNLDPNDELFVNWGPSYQIWHDQIWAPFCPGRIILDTAQLIFSFFSNPQQWAIVPKSVALKAQKTGKYSIFLLGEVPPPNRVCYKITHRHPKASAVEGIQALNYYFNKTFLDLFEYSV